MKKKPATPHNAAELRSQAEAKLNERKKKTAAPPAKESDLQRLVHELEVHQIELEMQNEEIMQSRAQVEAVLRKYTDLYDFAPIGYFTLARDGAIHQTNLAGANLLGVERAALIKRRFGVFVSAQSGTTFSDFLDDVFTSSSKKTCEVTLRKDGSAPLLVHIEAIKKDEQPEVCHTAVVDITERRNMQEALRVSETRYRRLFESAKDGILILDAETGIIVDMNPFLIKMLGYSHEPFKGKAVWELGFFKDVAASKENFVELQQREYIRYEDLPLKTKDGKKMDVEFISNVYHVNGTKTIQCIIRDITERKQTEKALEVSELRYRRLFESAQDGILLLDFNTGMITDVNPFLIDLLGYSKTDFLNKHLWEIGVFKDIIPSKDHFLELQNKRYIRYGDLPLEAKSGIRLDVEFISNAYLVDGTKTIQCNIRDITERKQTEKKLKAADEKLIEIFKKIQNQQNELERKSRNLEETNRHLDGFAYSVSHDLRAPLRSVSGFSQVLLDEYKDKADDQMKHYLERISIGTKKMGDLIDALLRFSRTTRADLQYETVDVEKIVTNIIKDQTAAHLERDIDFVVQPLPKVEADGKMVEMIFINLIENAVKFTSKRKNTHIEICSRQDNDEQQFFVKDDGAGFDMKFKDKLFVAFQRLHLENEFEGNGIGLTTVARLVTKHGGRVWAEGEVDKGATFYFTLPLKTSNLKT